MTGLTVDLSDVLLFHVPRDRGAVGDNSSLNDSFLNKNRLFGNVFRLFSRKECLCIDFDVCVYYTTVITIKQVIN